MHLTLWLEFCVEKTSQKSVILDNIELEHFLYQKKKKITSNLCLLCVEIRSD